jgi:hypothetical protein
MYSSFEGFWGSGYGDFDQDDDQDAWWDEIDAQQEVDDYDMHLFRVPFYDDDDEGEFVERLLNVPGLPIPLGVPWPQWRMLQEADDDVWVCDHGCVGA